MESEQRTKIISKLQSLDLEDIMKLEQAFFSRSSRLRQKVETGAEPEKEELNWDAVLGDLNAQTETDTVGQTLEVLIARHGRGAHNDQDNNSMETVEGHDEDDLDNINNVKSSMFKLLFPKLIPEYLRRIKYKKSLVAKSIFKSRFESKKLNDYFLENEKEYFFKCNKGNLGEKQSSDPLANLLKRRKKVKKIKASWFQPVFTAEELKLKKYFVKRVQRDYIKKGICFQYCYSPESRFDSMEDVIDPIAYRASEARKNPAAPPSIEHEYHPRAYTFPRDRLYFKGEFVENIFSEECTELMPEHSTGFQNHVSTKNDFYLSSGFLVSKNFFPIRSGVDSRILFKKSVNNQILTTEESRRESSSRIKKREESENWFSISKSFLTDWHEVDKQQIETFFQDQGKESIPRLFVEEVARNQDKTQDMNWSGEQVMSRFNYPKSRVKKVLGRMNTERHDIWIQGHYRPLIVLQGLIQRLVSSSLFNSFVMLCVLVNTLVLMMDNLFSDEVDMVLSLINQWLTLVFAIEFILKLIALGVPGYCRDGFNIFDGVIVLVSIVEISANLILDQNTGSALSAFRALRILRSLRVLRVTRLLRSLKFMTVIITVIVETLEQFLYVAILLVLFLYIYALLGMQTFGGNFKGFSRLPRNNFDSFTWSFLTIFQLMTFENWVDILELCWNTTTHKAITILFFFSWICIGNYIFFNLFLALLLGGFDSPSVMLSLNETEDHYKEMENVINMYIEQEKEDKQERDRRIFNQKSAVNILKDEEEARSSLIEYDDDFLKLDKGEQATRGVYFPPRDAVEDHSSFDDEFDRIFDSIVNPPKPKAQDIFANVTSNYSLYLFSKKNRFRRAISTIASSPL